MDNWIFFDEIKFFSLNEGQWHQQLQKFNFYIKERKDIKQKKKILKNQKFFGKKKSNLKMIIMQQKVMDELIPAQHQGVYISKNQ